MIAWRGYLTVGVIAIVGHLLLPVGLARDAVFCVIAGSGPVMVIVGIRRYRPARPSAWYLLAAGFGSWVLGSAIGVVCAAMGETGAILSLVKVAQLAAYPLFSAGLVILVRSRGRELVSTAVIDTAIVAVGVGLLSWVYRIDPALAAAGSQLSDQIVAVGYPLGAVMFVAALVRLAFAPRVRSMSAVLLAGGVGAMLAAEALAGAATWVPAIAAHLDVVELLWLCAYVLWGAAALHPAMVGLTQRPTMRGDFGQVGRQAVLAIAAMAGPIVLVGEHAAGVAVHAWPVAIAIAALVVLVFLRMSAAVRHMTAQSDELQVMVDTDYITGLANGRRFTAAVAAFHRRGAHTERVVLSVVEMDRFAAIEETLGTRTGEAILRAFGARVAELAGPAALVARIGEHSFAVLAPWQGEGAFSDSDAGQLRVALERPLELLGLSVSAEVKVGFLVLPDDAVDEATALHRIDLALAAAAVRPDRTARYAAELEAGDERAPALIGELPGALERGEIVLHYQPQVDLSTGLVVGLEALARWQHPRRGLLGPDLFIAAAERTGLIGPLTQYVLNEALAQNARWHAAGLDLRVAVNLSVRNLLDPGLLDDIRDALRAHGLDPRTLELEITESTAMVDPRRSLEVLGALAELGITLSIDDYGTGHSSLAYLQRLPVQRLKIDRSFVTDILTDPASAAIVASTIELARHLHLDVVAEGVENDATMLRLRELACPGAQGFGIGRPVAGPLVPALVRAIEARVPAVLASTNAQTDNSKSLLPPA